MKQYINLINLLENEPLDEGYANLFIQKVGQLFKGIESNTHFELKYLESGPPINGIGDKAVTEYPDAQTTMNARNKSWTRITKKYPGAITKWRGKFENPGKNRAFLIMGFVDETATTNKKPSPPVIWGAWVSSLNYTTKTYSMGKDVQTNMGLRQLNRNAYDLKPNKVLNTTAPLTARQIVTIINQNSSVPQVIKNLTNEFVKSSSNPWIIPANTFQDTAQGAALYGALTVDFCEILQPLGLMKSNPIAYENIQDLQGVSKKVFGSSEDYKNAKISFIQDKDDSSESTEETALLDSRLVNANGSQILISTKKASGRGSNLGARPNISTIYNRFANSSKLQKSIIPNFSEKTIRIFQILGTSKPIGGDEQAKSVTHVFDAAMELGIFSKKDVAAAKAIWNGDTTIDIRAYPNLKNITESNQKYQTIRQNLIYNTAKEVENIIKNDKELNDLIIKILNSVNFVQIYTDIKAFTPTKDMAINFIIKAPSIEKSKISFDIDANYMATNKSPSGPSGDCRFKVGVMDKKADKKISESTELHNILRLVEHLTKKY